MLKRPAQIVFVLLLLNHPIFGQDTNLDRRSGDTNHVYNRIEKFSNQRRITRIIFPLFFKPSKTVLSTSQATTEKQESQSTYFGFEGKIIRKINIVNKDPFGYDVNDTSRHPHLFPERVGNKLHINSLPITIRNYLLIRRNEPFDSLLVMESERLVRKQGFVRDISLTPFLVSPDSVDIMILVQDVWSIVPDGSISPESYTLKIKEDNFLGTGHQLRYVDNHDINSAKGAYEVGYVIPNIDNSYITASLGYFLAQDKSYIKNINIDRSFYSPYARWAGGILIKQQLHKDSLILSDSHRILQSSKLNTYDYWGGSAWQILKGRSEAVRNTNLVITARCQQSMYVIKPSEIYDSLNTFENGSTYLASIGINSRKYIRDKFLFRFGVTEDIPIGRNYTVIGGYQVRNSQKIGYIGIKTSWGDYYSKGYLGGNLEYGTFFNKSGMQEGALVAGITYFTNLIELGNWRFRQFVKTDIVLGFNRLPVDKIIFNDYMGVGGFDGDLGNGTRKLHFTLQTQSYAPWNLLGFRLGPFLTATAGMLGDESDGFSKSRVYSYLGLGVLIKNDFLNANYIQISLSYYPVIPQLGNQIFRANSIQPSDLRLQEFEQGKPDIVAYH
jgi:hypothetical protein